MVAPSNRISVYVLLFFPTEVHEVLELHFHFITVMSLLHFVLIPILPIENI